MCGIAGLIGSVGSQSVAVVQRMADAQAHRGPDDSGVWSERGREGRGGVVLGHRRLSIIDTTTRGRQPMVDKKSGCAIVYNGEVFNFVDLRNRLIAAGAEFVSDSDTEVVLEAYVRWGDRFVSELEGMFAFAIWDPRSSEVLLVRDRLGVKPLYMARCGDAGERTELIFASEVRALLASRMLPRKINREALTTYLWNGFVVGPRAIVDRIEAVPAGTLVRVTANGVPSSPERYWKIPIASSGRTRSYSRVEECLTRAIRSQLISDVPLGIFLSGGVDSTTIAAVASRVSRDSVRTFNVRFEEAGFDESGHARAVASALDTRHEEVLITASSFQVGLDDALRSLDQPTFDAINTFFISRAVRNAGLTVAIAGTGGDEVFGGYRSFVDLPRIRVAGRIAALLPKLARGAISRSAIKLHVGGRATVPSQTRWGKLGDLLNTHGDLLALYQVAYGLFTRDFLHSLTESPGDLYYGLPHGRAKELRKSASSLSTREAISVLELSIFLGERLLRDTDCASMASSLEVRVPLVDHRVIEAAADLDPRWRYLPAGRKQVLRTLSGPEIDPSIFDRPKAGFELPLDSWIRTGLRSSVADILLDRNCLDRVGLSEPRIRELWSAYCAGAPGLYWSRIWSIYVLLWWVREHDISI
jgi:asparagine synthase (glutamine-hydrolysing)